MQCKKLLLVRVFRRKNDITAHPRAFRLHQVACGNEPGKIEMSEVSNLLVGCHVEGASSSTITVARLDDIIDEPVDFVKLDIEGAEPKALEGMQRILSESRPVLITELNEYWLREVAGSSSRAYVSQLESAGYRVLPASSFARGGDETLDLPDDDPLFVTEVVWLPVDPRSPSKVP